MQKKQEKSCHFIKNPAGGWCCGTSCYAFSLFLEGLSPLLFLNHVETFLGQRNHNVIEDNHNPKNFLFLLILKTTNQCLSVLFDGAKLLIVRGHTKRFPRKSVLSANLLT